MSEAFKLKVGILVVGAVVLTVLTVVWLGSAERWAEKISCVTYFSESVLGLDEGSQVRYRGIPFGHVSRITIAPDREHVAVHFEVHVSHIDPETVTTLRNLSKEDWTKNGLRMRVASQGFTGVKLLEGDVLDPRAYPVEPLPFKLPRNFIPSAPSTFTNLERSAMRIIGSIEEADIKGVAESIKSLMASVERLTNEARGRMSDVSLFLEAARKTLETFEKEIGPLAASTAQTMKNVDRLTAAAEGALQEMNLPKLTAEVQSLARKLDQTADRFATVAERIGASAEGVAGTAQDLRGDLRGPLLELERTLQSIRALVDYLERNPAAVIQGRTPRDGGGR
jgi:ABC-type transporter Mla subunit MlaD